MIPVEVVFNPNWWHLNYGICFDQSFYLDRQTRIDNDVNMRKALFDRFGFGESNPSPRPVIGSMMVAGGFMLPALFGVPIKFSDNEAPWPKGLTMTDEDIMQLRPPDLPNTWPMNTLLQDIPVLMDSLGYVIGDFDLDGLFNTALHLRGQRIFMDLMESPQVVDHLFGVLAETYVSLVNLMRSLTGSCSIATNRSIIHVDPAIFLHSNCSVSMVSPGLYKKTLLKYELYLAERLQPYGIHHCGDNLHQFIHVYNQVPTVFFDVGWGSNVEQVRKACPNSFLNLRLSPVRMQQCTSAEIYQDTLRLLKSAGTPERVGVCCINMDAGTHNDNVLAMAAAASDYAHQYHLED